MVRRRIPILLVAFLTACGEDKPTAPSDERIVVRGTVLDQYGRAIAGAVVRVSDRPEVTTSSDGVFSVDNVVPPYDLAVSHSYPRGVVYPDGFSAFLYVGLRRADPLVVSFLDPCLEIGDETPLAVSVRGHVPANDSLTVDLVDEMGHRSLLETGGLLSTGEYALGLYWPDDVVELAGRIFVYRSTATENGSRIWRAFASRALNLRRGEILEGIDFGPADLVDPQELGISGTISVPEFLTRGTQTVDLVIDSVTLPAVATGVPLTPEFSYSVPDIPGATFTIHANASYDPDRIFGSTQVDTTGVVAGSSGVRLSLPLFSLLDFPRSPVSRSTVFSWVEGLESHISVVSLRPYLGDVYGCPLPRFDVTLFLPGPDAKLIDLASRLLQFEPLEEVSFEVKQWTGWRSTDDAAGPGRRGAVSTSSENLVRIVEPAQVSIATH